eukprot:Hpha_TRINITY_DN14576_c0_g1::TRINITY_DN14576_c0_g1_i1::g.46723::m.46723
MSYSKAKFEALFNDLAVSLSTNGWITQQEAPPASPAYLHLSRKTWGDERMNGIHIELYVLDGQIARRKAPVCLHCEGGCAFQSRFLKLMGQRARESIDGWNKRLAQGDLAYTGRWELLSHAADEDLGSSVCEIQMPFGANEEETVRNMVQEVRRLQGLLPLIDRTIGDCGGVREGDCDIGTVTDEVGREGAGCAPAGTAAGLTAPLKKRKRIFTPEEIEANNKQRGDSVKKHLPFLAVIDGYVVDATDFIDTHPGGVSKLLSVNSKAAGWTREKFGFSFSKGANSHFPQTAQTFREGVLRFEQGVEGAETEACGNAGFAGDGAVDIVYPSLGTLRLLGKLEAKN